MKGKQLIIIFVFALYAIEMNATLLQKRKYDPLFSVKPQRQRRQRKLSIHKEDRQTLAAPPKPQKRKLVLDWFNDDHEKKEQPTHQNMDKLIELMKLANSFHDDPNVEVGLSIRYKNQIGGATEPLHDRQLTNQPTTQNSNNPGNTVKDGVNYQLPKGLYV